MAQRKQLTWTELRVGLFVLVGMFVLAAAITSRRIVPEPTS